MNRFKNILYVLDGTNQQEEELADKISFLARLNEARISVVRLAEETFVEQFGRNLSPRVEELGRLTRRHLQEELDRFISHDRWHGLDVSARLIAGEKGFITVIRTVLREGHDLVVKAGRPPEEVDQLAMHLFRKCPCPVWVIHSTHSEEFRRILAAIDVNTRHEETRQMNRKIVELAFSLAQREQGEAHYLHVWQLEYETLMRSTRLNVSPDEVQAFKKELRQTRQEALHQLLRENHIQAKAGQIHLIEGKTVQTIEHTLADLQIDVLVMGTLGRSGIPGLLIGNRAEEILSTIHCTVLAVKPDGFISPIEI